MGLIRSTGSYLPKNILTNDELSTMVDTSDEWIFSRTGIKSRHIAKTETATDMAFFAAKAALKSAGVEAGELGMIIAATLTAENQTPSLGCEVMRLLGAQCPAFDINAACSGFLYALSVAQALYADKPILVVACEKLSTVTDWTDRSTCVLFGDGAGAVVIADTGKGKVLKTNMNAFPDTKESLIVTGLNTLDKETGLLERSKLFMDGREVYKFATSVLVSEIKRTLAELDLSPQEIKYYVPHQANSRIIDSAAQKLGVDRDRFYMNIHHTGNTSCASIPIAFDEFVCENETTLKKGDLIVLCAFGGGLTSGISVIEWQ